VFVCVYTHKQTHTHTHTQQEITGPTKNSTVPSDIFKTNIT